jgi:hypothetical protein
MTENKENENSSYKPVNVIDCENYVKLDIPKSPGFENNSKSINDINDSLSHNVVEFYGQL